MSQLVQTTPTVPFATSRGGVGTFRVSSMWAHHRG